MMNQDNYKDPFDVPRNPPEPWRVESVVCSVRDLDMRSSVARLSYEMTLDGLSQLFSTPKIRRLSMVPNPIDRNPLGRLWRRICGSVKSRGTSQQDGGVATRASNGKSENAPWRRAARFRRIALLILIILQTSAASWSLTNTFPYPWMKGSEIAILGMFAILFSWISFGFWTALAGFWMRWRRVKEFTVADLCCEQESPPPLRSRTAVLMPICNENVVRVFAGLEASYRSLAATSELRQFDFYVLSDTSDPEKQVEERVAWAQTCRTVQGFGKIFYRHRRNNIRRKSGNIADFLRRWGQNYDYMIVFDADSVMAGETLVRLARIMDLHPQAGIVQTAPTTVNCDSFFGRVQQFASRAYGPMLVAGLRFWQLGESYYWGHNAILRIAPFVKYCGLSRLPGNPPLGGEILSHDFVEAALMGRAGWEVWVVHDLAGSYEESPPTLADELKRDRRWCQGNLQHLRLLFGEGIHGGHRAIFSMGVMAYLSAPLWFLFLVLNTAEIALQPLLPPTYFSSEPSLFPLWPQWHPEWAIALFSTTAGLLFLPKLLSLVLILKNREAHLFGGLFPLCASIVSEIFVSTLLAPVRMWFHSRFVVLTLMGKQIKWGPQSRTDNETGWMEASRLHGFSTLLALAWIAGISWMNPAASVWLLPVASALFLSIPLSVYSSRVSLGRAVRRWRLFLIPEEVAPPQIIKDLRASLARRHRQKWAPEGFVRAAINPYVNAVHIGLLRGKMSKPAGASTKQIQRLFFDPRGAGVKVMKTFITAPVVLASRELAR
ncbi:MAG TPA: glucans biosynthesis glucosyltransferase MdoH [Candidatus Binatia bacterium]|nr:glucans biosynthesis glucosyltransferase MdoH [Candidatus Binatia bacterium]